MNLLKTDYNAEITEIETKATTITELARTSWCKKYHTLRPHFTTSDCNGFTAVILNAKIKEMEVVDKSDTSGFIYKPDLDKKVVTLLTKT